jgi:hypothetical protein
MDSRLAEREDQRRLTLDQVPQGIGTPAMCAMTTSVQMCECDRCVAWF